MRKQEDNRFGSWHAMKTRCLNPNHPTFKNYGARGITVCEQWMYFDNFIADMGSKPHQNATIERIDNQKGYSPDNCRWASRKEQSRNRRTNTLYSLNGQTMCQKEWAETLGFKAKHLRRRIKRMGLQKALTLPKKVSCIPTHIKDSALYL